MIDYRIEENVPRFILKDKNGYALAKALEAGVRWMESVIQNGFTLLTDIDQMPGWRLDELAWETNAPYDNNASIAQKREWLKRATPMYRYLGTLKGVQQYLDGYFSDVLIQEAQEYGGDPFHFRVTLFGTVTPSSLSWARKAVQQVKPVRSVMQDDLRIGVRTTIQLRVRSGVKYIVAFPYAGEPLTGTVPKTAIGLKDAPNAMTISTSGVKYIVAFPYAGEPLTGTVPKTAIGLKDAPNAMTISTEEWKASFPLCGEVTTE